MTSKIGTASFDVIIIGGSQAGLAVGYHLAQRGLRYVILDAGSETGHAWRSRWDSLTLFTPAQHSGLPGMAFPRQKDTYPSKDDVASYLEGYVSAFDLPLRLNAKVTSLTLREGAYVVATTDEEFTASQVLAATGPFQVPFVPPVTDEMDEAVVQIHSARVNIGLHSASFYPFSKVLWPALQLRHAGVTTRSQPVAMSAVTFAEEQPCPILGDVLV